MKTTKASTKGRRAISPVIATVILIAITLIAAIAIAGFVFGIFGSFSSSATVTVTGVAIPSGATSGAFPSTATCSTSAAAPYVAISNSGTGSTTVTGISITYAGNTYSATISGCTIGAAGSATATYYVEMTGFTPLASQYKGIQFVGAVTLGNGASVSYTGTFS
jgi:flagellin-like protein